MSSKKGKSKKVSQNDLRKMMNDMKTKRSANTTDRRTLAANSEAYKKALADQKRIEELRKGANLSKTESDREKKILPEKSNAKKSDLTSSVPSKRTFSDENGSSHSNFKEPSAKITKVEAKVKEYDKKPGGLIIGDYGSDSDDEKEEEMETENKLQETNKEVKEKEDSSEKPSSTLPEGFFDDPEADAKIRGVETPSNVMDREWEDFQREIQKETDQSEQIVDEEQEIGKVDREIDEINEQIMHFSRVEKLNDVRDEIKEKKSSKKKEDPKESDGMEQEESESDDEDLDEDLLDWREKDSHF